MKNTGKMLTLALLTGAFLSSVSLNAEADVTVDQNTVTQEAGDLNLNDSSADNWWGGGWAGYGLGYGLGGYGYGLGGYGLGCCGGYGYGGFGWY